MAGTKRKVRRVGTLVYKGEELPMNVTKVRYTPPDKLEEIYPHNIPHPEVQKSVRIRRIEESQNE